MWWNLESRIARHTGCSHVVVQADANCVSRSTNPRTSGSRGTICPEPAILRQRERVLSLTRPFKVPRMSGIGHVAAGKPALQSA